MLSATAAMNHEAYVTLVTLLALDAALLTLLLAFPKSLDAIDRAFIYIALVLHGFIYYGLAHHNHLLIYIAHVGYALYVILAPFFTRSFTGKCIYTTLVALQFLLLVAHKKCMMSHIQFNPKDTAPHLIFPSSIPIYVFAIVQSILLIIIWTRHKTMKLLLQILLAIFIFINAYGLYLFSMNKPIPYFTSLQTKTPSS